MKQLSDFLISALPWIAIGLFIACFIVMMQTRKNKKELSRLFKEIALLPALCFVIAAIIEINRGNTSNGVVWFLLGSFNMIINYVYSQLDENDG